MTATASVLSELAKSDLPIEAQACVAAIIEGETPQVEGDGYSPWNILYSGAGALTGTPGLVSPADAANILMIGKYRYWKPPLTEFPAWSGGKLASGNFSTAAGGPQITRSTWFDNSAFGIASFDPQSQAAFTWMYAQTLFANRAGRALLSVLQGSDSDRVLVTTYLGTKPYLTWPGGCDVNFTKRYDANLAALQATPVPTPVPTPIPTTETITVSLADQSGRKGSGTVALISMAGAAILAGAVMMAPQQASAPATPILENPVKQSGEELRSSLPDSEKWPPPALTGDGPPIITTMGGFATTPPVTAQAACPPRWVVGLEVGKPLECRDPTRAAIVDPEPKPPEATSKADEGAGSSSEINARPTSGGRRDGGERPAPFCASTQDLRLLLEPPACIPTGSGR